MAKADLTAQRLRELLHYDPQTGVFTWLVNRGGTAVAGSCAGHVDDVGYIRFVIDGSRRRAHQFAWLYMTGEWPKNQIDHKDRCRSNNAWANLRPATQKQNSENMNRCEKYSSPRGVRWDSARNKWAAQIGHASKTIHLGRFDGLEEAVVARMAAEKRLYTHATTSSSH